MQDQITATQLANEHFPKMPRLNHLRIGTWNAQGISNIGKATELRTFLTRTPLDILCIQETFFNEQSKLYVPGYTIHRTDRSTHGGGVAICIKKGLQHKATNHMGLSSMESVTVEIQLCGRSVLFSSCYLPRFHASLKRDLEKMFGRNKEHIIGGDFNAHHTSWGAAANNQSGISIYDFQLMHGMCVYTPDEHTRVPHNGQNGSTIDFFMSNSAVLLDSIRVNRGLISDHVAVEASLHLCIETHKSNRFDYKKANWATFKVVSHQLLRHCMSPTTNLETETIIDKITNAIHEAKEKAVPLISVSDFPNEVSPATLKQIAEKNRLQRRLLRSRDQAEQRTLRSLINQMKTLIGISATNDRNANWTRTTERVKDNPKKIWNLARTLKGKSSKLPNLFTPTGQIITTDQEKADLIGDFFAEANRAHFDTNADDQHMIDDADAIRNDHNIDETYVETSMEEIRSVLKSFRPLKSPGIDGIPNVCLKQLPNIAIKLLCDTFNYCLSTGYWPTSFKYAKVIPIGKVNSPTQSSHYRPISLINTIAKLYERIVLERLKQQLEEHRVIPDHQFGFRAQHSAQHQALRAVHQIRANKAAKKSTGVVLLDIRKAFDSVWVDGMIWKLLRANINRYLVRCIANFATDRIFAVHIGVASSKRHPLIRGLPQGSCLSPQLYNAFTADLKVSRKVTISQYADDTMVAAAGLQHRSISTAISKALTTIDKFFTRWQIKINTDKTHACFFPLDGKKKRWPTGPLQFGDDPIVWQRNIKYLGIIFDSKLLWRDHIQKARTKAIAISRATYALTAKSSKLPARTKVNIYKAIVRPIFMYGSSMWRTAALTHRKSLQTIQNRCLKTCLSLHWRHRTTDVHQRANIPTVDEFCTDLHDRTMRKASASPYPLLRALVN